MAPRAFLAVVLALLLPSAAHALVGTAQRGRTCVEDFRVLPFLSHVTSSAIRINMMPEDSIDLRASLSLANQSAYGLVAQVTETGATADTRTHLTGGASTFTSLAAGTQFKYLVECRGSSAEPWRVVQRAFFKTLQTSSSANVRVAVLADDHTSQLWSRQTCQDANGEVASSITGRKTRRLDMIAKTRRNVAAANPDFVVNLGDHAMLDLGPACTWTREDGSTVAYGASAAADLATQRLRWEVMLHYWQPLLAFYPYFMIQGNHEGLWGFGSGVPGVCVYDQTLADSAVQSMHDVFGNPNDAYDNGSADADLDGDTVTEDQEEGVYYEFASGSLRWFIINSLRYRDDADNGGGAVPASLFPGFTARTADWPPALFGDCPPQTAAPAATDGDTYEDNATLGATQTAWLIAQMGAASEAFKVVASHRIVGGINPTDLYFYQRGSITTHDDDMDGFREVTESWDPDGDGDLMDEHYIGALMASSGSQIRFTGHDHAHVICRKDGMHYISVGQPSCATPEGRAEGGCTPVWVGSSQEMLDQGIIDSTFVRAADALHDSYDCDENGVPDYKQNVSPTSATIPFVNNGGITGVNGTLNHGFGLLLVNGSTSMEWQWIVTDPWDFERNNDTVITYGPIVP